MTKINGKNKKAIKLFTCFEERVAFVDCDLCEHHVEIQNVSVTHGWTVSRTCRYELLALLAA